MGKRSRKAQVESTLQRVMQLRGEQRFYYHVHSLLMDHRWDHEDALNYVQRELEATFGRLLVEMVSVREWPAHNGKMCVCFYYRIGPLPAPDTPFPVQKPTMLGIGRPSEMRL